MSYSTIKFYNPRQGAFQLDIALTKVRGHIIMANSMGGNTFRPKAGDKIYDWENKMVFSLMPEEAIQIKRWLKLSYNNSNAKPLTLSHSPSGNMKEDYTTLFLVTATRDGEMTVTITMTNSMKQKCVFTISKERITLFNDWLEFVSKLYLVNQAFDLLLYKSQMMRQGGGNGQNRNSRYGSA